MPQLLWNREDGPRPGRGLVGVHLGISDRAILRDDVPGGVFEPVKYVPYIKGGIGCGDAASRRGDGKPETPILRRCAQRWLVLLVPLSDWN